MSQREKQILELVIPIKFSKEAPFPTSRLTDILVEHNYEMEDQDDERIIAEDGSRTFLYDLNDAVINMRVSDSEELTEGFNQLKEILFNNLEILSEDIESIGISLTEMVWKGESTVETFQDFYEPLSLTSHFDQESKPASVRFVSHNELDSTRNDGYDVKIEPYMKNPDYYYVELLYKKPSFDEIESLVENLQGTVDKFIDQLEEGGANNE